MAEDQRAFVTQTRDLLTWLGELRGVTAADEDELRSCRLALDEHWDDWLPLERDVLFDELAAVYCDPCAAGRLDLDSPTFRAFKHHLAVFAPPTENPCAPRTRQRLPDWVKLDTLVWDVVEIYNNSREIRAWKKAFSAALSESTVRRLSSPAFESLYEDLEARRDALRKMAHDLPPVKRANLPGPDEALARAQHAVQPLAERFAAYVELLGSFATLYKTKGGTDADELAQAARDARTAVALQHFAALGPRQPRYLADLRDQLFLTCELFHSARGYLPSSRALLGKLLRPLLEANAPHLRESADDSFCTPRSEHEVIDLCTPSPSTASATRARASSKSERRRDKEQRRARGGGPGRRGL